ncbi:glycosyltransferase [Rhodobacteraceae bacterium D3-12]|nr:glycosyltransferase [Rhodobacteraceae bacterium D3-12]
MKVALVHYWLVGMRGGERVLEELIRLYPDADIFTHVADRENLSDLISSRPITESLVARLPAAKKHYQKYLGLMPRALEEFDLSGYDLVVSSESGPAKGVIVPPGTPHVCYVHTPMRYIWDHYPAYKKELGPLLRMYFSRLAHRLRIWDVTSAARVDHFVANSSFVAERIKRFYRRDAVVVHPPVDLDAYQLPSGASKRDAYLFVSQLVPYKRADLVVEAFRGIEQSLVVVGDGSQRAELERDLPSNVALLGKVPGKELTRLYQNARALIFPAEEDFGIVPLEAMACGTPVLAYGRGELLIVWSTARQVFSLTVRA